MVTLVKHEWHSVDSQFAFELDIDTLSEIYPDMKKRELKQLMKEIESGEADVEEIINEAWNNDIEIEWDRQYDDWWTDRKGGYEVTYELGDESSWHHTPPPPEPTHKCTKCKWKGQSYDADWKWEDENGDRYKEAKKICPMCDSDTELTEQGLKEEADRKKWDTEWEETDKGEQNDD